MTRKLNKYGYCKCMPLLSVAASGSFHLYFSFQQDCNFKKILHSQLCSLRPELNTTQWWWLAIRYYKMDCVNSLYCIMKSSVRYVIHTAYCLPALCKYLSDPNKDHSPLVLPNLNLKPHLRPEAYFEIQFCYL